MCLFVCFPEDTDKVFAPGFELALLGSSYRKIWAIAKYGHASVVLSTLFFFFKSSAHFVLAMPGREAQANRMREGRGEWERMEKKKNKTMQQCLP